MNNIFRYFSQYGEDFLLWNFFDFKTQGFFIDIGAFDGIHLSNSYSFELIGWKGICVEPHPFYYNLCKENRPGAICINKACGASEQSNVVLHVDNTGLFSSLKKIGSDENIVYHFGLLKDIDIKLDSIEVDIVSVDTILGEHKINEPIDFISIDVEGAEFDVLKGFDLGRYAPRVVVVETNNERTKKEINDYLRSKGYLFARGTKANSFYVTMESDVEKFNSFELNCIIEKQIHPLGAEYTIPSYLEGLVLYKGKGSKIFNILHECATQKEKLAECQGKISRYDGWVKELNEKNKNKNDQIKNIENKIITYQEKVRKFDQWIKELRDANNKKTERIQFLENELNVVRNKLENLREVSSSSDGTSSTRKEKLSDTWGAKLRKLLGKE